MPHISIIGAGKWGQALHYALSIKQKCFITSRKKRSINNFVDLQTAINCNYLIITIPTQQTRQWLKENFQFNNQKILVASKGIEENTGKFLNEIYEEFIPKENLAFLSGPSFALEITKRLPCALVLNTINKDFFSDFKNFFPTFIKLYLSDDLIGAEICGAYKNVLAIASGICEGLKLGNNAKASLIARGLVEMQRFGNHFGSKMDTFLGLSGSGDLFLTANSILSRNFRVGLGLAQNKPLEKILDDLGEVAEGVKTSYAINSLATKYNIYTPIAKEVYLILNGKNPKNSLKDLLGY